MSTQKKISAAEDDHKHYLEVRDSEYVELLAYAAKSSGRSVMKTQLDFNKVSKVPGRLNMVEYVRNGLHHIDRYTDSERAAFISNDLHWPITHKCNHNGWSAAAEDKVVAYTLLEAAGVPVPKTLAVIDKSNRIYPRLKTIATAEQLRDVLLENLGSGLFGKITEGMVSFGAFLVKDANETTIVCEGRDPVSYETFLAEIVGDNSYVLQSVIQNHPDISQYASALATVRMVNLVRENDVYCPMAIIKIPQGDNIADAFWRPGNIACSVNVETGKIETVARRADKEVEFLDDHPEVKGLMGLQLPFWRELVEVNERAARTFAPIRYQSTDISITESGPVVVELNYGGGFDLPQYASGRGMLTSEVREFFEGFGWDFNEQPKKKFWPFRR
ncbi:sugar-transfer associated ATP-grasp domain-containing protein [Ruegeria lacuscaerulensis]|uniref:sugar-transfer associated ATP-grasp domain-containing protein n=1 Tax=Ruegeria lacuscaerulensis TaxID=55218 RepID=UPI00147AA063|nr:sugar-transfer associated ATP-grasp domain-containing protein [Ruegeria lacuscaerulensis]